MHMKIVLNEFHIFHMTVFYFKRTHDTTYFYSSLANMLYDLPFLCNMLPKTAVAFEPAENGGR